MASDPVHLQSLADLSPLAQRYQAVRARSLELVENLETEDYVVQSMPDVSPAKWHLAHVTWFFERFVLARHAERYEPFNPQYDYLFNSYYQTVGQMHARPQRGLLSRPTVADVKSYRAHVDAAMRRLIEGQAGNTEFEFLVTLGLKHEQQHQELMLTDIKHVFSVNPLGPALVPARHRDSTDPGELSWIGVPGGMYSVGAKGDEFCFDNETPRHEALIRDLELASRPVTNAEFRNFIDAGGYRDAALWLSDGWGWVQQEGIDRPLYWDEPLEREFTLSGWQPVDPHAPVCHVSLYEADAYARWAEARLPTEFEWETAAARVTIDGNFADSGVLRPLPSRENGDKLHQVFGDVWEWTASSYAPYPGFQPLDGSLGEYNGKFMANQMVCRGGSCATAADHVRLSYRNFFYPHQRWQFLGFRLARDAG
jgi:ergothioneine biosynthesis protein EgtB